MRLPICQYASHRRIDWRIYLLAGLNYDLFNLLNKIGIIKRYRILFFASATGFNIKKPEELSMGSTMRSTKARSGSRSVTWSLTRDRSLHESKTTVRDCSSDYSWATPTYRTACVGWESFRPSSVMSKRSLYKYKDNKAQLFWKCLPTWIQNIQPSCK